MTAPPKSAPPPASRGTFTRNAIPGYRWVYLWHWPIRAMHWVAALCVVVLVVTGLYIGRPYFAGGPEASSPFLMGWMRFLHFTAAALLVATAIVRVYWLFVGNKFETWKALLPVRAREWANAWRMIKFYVFLSSQPPPRYLGHNPLQQLSYTAVYALATVQVITGFTMYGQANPAGLFYRFFGWVVPLLGGIQVVRFVHHVLTWLFVIFIPIHVYLALRADVLERTGTISSIVSGGRFVPADVSYVDD